MRIFPNFMPVCITFELPYWKIWKQFVVLIMSFKYSIIDHVHYPLIIQRWNHLSWYCMHFCKRKILRNSFSECFLLFKRFPIQIYSSHILSLPQVSPNLLLFSTHPTLSCFSINKQKSSTTNYPQTRQWTKTIPKVSKQANKKITNKLQSY